jgi:hypothetical protein
LLNMSPSSSLTGTTQLLGFFTGVTAPGAMPDLPEDGKVFEYVCENGYWTLTPNVQPSAGAYDLTLFPLGLTCHGPYQSIAKRTNSASAWTFGGSTPVSPNQRSGFTSFSEFAQVDAEEPLPVELLHFFGAWKNQAVELTWKTASERNNDYFEVQRSADGQHYVPIGRVAGQASSSRVNIYRFDDQPGSSGSPAAGGSGWQFPFLDNHSPESKRCTGFYAPVTQSTEGIGVGNPGDGSRRRRRIPPRHHGFDGQDGFCSNHTHRAGNQRVYFPCHAVVAPWLVHRPANRLEWPGEGPAAFALGSGVGEKVWER